MNRVFYNTDNNDNYISKGYQQNPTVYSIINLINNAAKRVPYQILRVKDVGKAKSYKSMTSGHLDANSIVASRILKERAFEEVSAPDLENLLERPNPMQGYTDLIENLIAFRKLTGNGYLWGISPDNGSNKGKPLELHVLPSQCVEIVGGGHHQPVKEYKLSYNPQEPIDAEKVCHIKDFNPEYDAAGSQLYGQSPLRAGFRTLETNNEATDTGKKMLQNQAARGVLVPKEAGNMTETQGKQLQESLKEKMKDNRGGIAMAGTPVEWIDFGLSVTDLALIEQYNLTIKDLCNIYGVRVELLNNTEASTYNNMKEIKQMFFQNAVLPELCKIRDSLNSWLVPAYGEDLYLDYDFSAIPELQQDMEKLAAWLFKAPVTMNEQRVALNYPEDMDNPLLNEYFVDQGRVPLSDLDIGRLIDEGNIE